AASRGRLGPRAADAPGAKDAAEGGPAPWLARGGASGSVRPAAAAAAASAGAAPTRLPLTPNAGAASSASEPSNGLDGARSRRCVSRPLIQAQLEVGGRVPRCGVASL